MYLLIAELLIGGTLMVTSMAFVEKINFQHLCQRDLVAGLKLKYRGMADEGMWVEAEKLFEEILSKDINLVNRFMKEIINTIHYGIDMKYSPKDLVMCTYRLRQQSDVILDDLALRSSECR